MNKFELTPDILHQAEQCKTVEEILAKAKEIDKDITPEQAQRVFDMSHASGAVSDEELESVAGGLPAEAPRQRRDCPYCQAVYMRQEDVKKHISERHPGKLNEYLAMSSTPGFNPAQLKNWK